MNKKKQLLMKEISSNASYDNYNIDNFSKLYKKVLVLSHSNNNLG